MNITQTIAEISSLPPLDRLRLAEAIWDSLDDASVPPPSEGQMRLLESRLAAHDADPSSVLSPEEIEQQVAELRSRR